MSLKKIVYLSCNDLDGYVTDDHLTFPELEKMEWHVDSHSWTADIDWKSYDAAIIRTTWDYTERLDEFLEKMKLISKQTRLVNCLETLQWNSVKTYLKDLKEWGLNPIPTYYEWPETWKNIFELWQTDQIMVKPQVGASSNDTHVITPKSVPSLPLFRQQPLIQPFRKNIFTEGELSFHFFNGQFSHAVRKVPKPNDYRVQEEHGGLITQFNPSPDLLKDIFHIFQTIEKNLKEPTLFHRIDVIYNDSMQLEIMEVELVEPSLYFRTNPEAPKNFAAALEKYLQ